MTTSQYVLNLGLLGYILYANLGTKTLTRQRFLLPLVLVAITGAVFLRDMPSAGNDTQLEIIAAAAGALLGVVAASLVRITRNTDGRPVAAAGPASRRCGSP